MISQELQHKIDSGIRLLQAVSQAHGGAPLEVAYSGGKDSDVVLQLVRESGVPFRAIYRNTTIDPPGTISHCKAQGVEIRHPKRTFFEMIEAKGLPNRKKRFCCAELKEYKILDVVVLGVRRDESPKRAAIYKEPTACRYYGAHKPENYTEQIYPILNWSIDDVRSFVADRNIKLAPHYYDPDGSLHFERRLGCIGCPLQSREEAYSRI